MKFDREKFLASAALIFSLSNAAPTAVALTQGPDNDVDSLITQSADDNQGPACEGPAMEGPAMEGPAKEGPAMEGPAMEGPAMEGPAMEGPAQEG